MDLRISLIVILFLINSCWSLPVQVIAKKLTNLEKQYTEELTEHKNPDVFETIMKENAGSSQLVHEGDIVVPPGRSAMICPDNSCFWPKSSDGIVYVPYTLSNNYSASDLATVKGAMQEFASLTCIHFIPHTTETDYLSLLSVDGCWSSLGRAGGGQQVSLSYGCLFRGTVQHELNHALGFYHEQSRSDRDDHVNIVTDNIIPGNSNNFNKENTNNLGLEYDFSSVMHYGMFAFSKAFALPTVIPKPDRNTPIGQRDGLSNLDVSKINTLYQCNVCSSLFNSPSGTVTSSNNPSSYPNNADCVYLIRVSSNMILLQFIAFDVQSSQGCTADYVKIYDGPSKEYPVLLDKACGTGLLAPVTSTGNTMMIEFVTDASGTASGFKASYSNVICGSTFKSSTGTITTPYYPNVYHCNMDCGYYIMAPVGYKVSLQFSTFAVEPDATCSADNLSIFDGSWTTSPLLGKYCGTQLPPSVTSSGNTLLLQFHSDYSWNFKGFQATYTFVKA